MRCEQLSPRWMLWPPRTLLPAISGQKRRRVDLRESDTTTSVLPLKNARLGPIRAVL